MIEFIESAALVVYRLWIMIVLAGVGVLSLIIQSELEDISKTVKKISDRSDDRFDVFRGMGQDLGTIKKQVQRLDDKQIDIAESIQTLEEWTDEKQQLRHDLIFDYLNGKQQISTESVRAALERAEDIIDDYEEIKQHRV